MVNNHADLKIPEGIYQETYTPVAGRIKSAVLSNPTNNNAFYLRYAKMILSADATCSWVDAMGNPVNGFALSKGPQPFLIRELSTTGGIAVVIVHDGLQDPGVEAI